MSNIPSSRSSSPAAQRMRRYRKQRRQGLRPVRQRWRPCGTLHVTARAPAKRRLLRERANDRLANVSEWKPAGVWNLERLARHRAAKLGYRVHRSRRRKSRDNAGEFMLIHKASSTVLLGAGYTANLEMILEFMERQLMH
jgi:hypothetical protein